MKDEPARYSRMVIRTIGRRVFVWWCNGRDVNDHNPRVLERVYKTMADALPDIQGWYEAKHGSA